MECWASSLGDCAGGQSGEHLWSKCLFDGKLVTLKGYDWCANDWRTIPVSQLTANILCRHHNQTLSEVDAEAKQFKHALLHATDPKSESRQRHIQLNGRRFGRWLCKTHCNQQAQSKQPPCDDFVQHCFRRSTRRKVRFFVTTTGQLEPNSKHFRYRPYYHGEDVICAVRFFGFPWFASNVDLSTIGPLRLGKGELLDSHDFLEAPESIESDVFGEKCTIVIRWNRA